jgi:hypothetical protein
MNKLVTLTAFAAILSLASCVTTVEVGPKPPKISKADVWSVSRLPRLANRNDFEILLRRMQSGTEQERCTYLVALQLYMDLCLPFIIEHLEDSGQFKDTAYPIVSRAGIKMADGLHAKGLNRGAALELFLISYFSKDPARRNVPKEREGAIKLWKNWHAQRKNSLRWNTRGLYNSR